SHTPPPSWLCYTAAGADAASHSNIALGASGPDAIDLYMDDPGSGNYAAGHRRWILYPPQAQMGTGDVEGGDAPEQGNALGVLYGFGSRPATPEWVAWPPPGFVPYWLLPSQSNRWSLSYPNADFSGAIVTMTRGTTPITVTYETQVNNQGYADNTLVWLPQGVSYSAPTSDTTYGITLSNVLVSGQSRTFSYAVTVIKPVKPAKLGDLDNDGFSDLVW